MLAKTVESPLDSKEIKDSQSERKSTLNIHWMLKLKFQYFGCLMLGKNEGRRGLEDEMVERPDDSM